MKVELSIEAEEDAVRAVRTYNARLGRFGPDDAAEIVKTIGTVGENPWLYPLFEFAPPGVELRVYHIRRFDLCVLYEVRLHDVLVLSVVHANTPPEKWRVRVTPPRIS